jgi:hypothetical protein
LYKYYFVTYDYIHVFSPFNTSRNTEIDEDRQIYNTTSRYVDRKGADDMGDGSKDTSVLSVPFRSLHRLSLDKRGVWDIRFSEDYPDLFCIAEKTRYHFYLLGINFF